MASNDIPVPEGERWLDLGCGPGKVPGAFGIDIVALPGVDIVHDVNTYPWPIQDGAFDHVVCRHSLSHLNDLIRAMEEIHRITKHDGIVEILAPHYASDNYNTDPTHRIAMGYRTMNYFCDNVRFKYQYYSRGRFELLQRHLSFRDNVTDFRITVPVNPFRWLGIEQLVNRVPRIYERFFVYWLPPSELYFRLQVKKKDDR